MKLLNENLIEIKKSKFYSYLYEIKSPTEVDDILNDLRKKHKKAVHFPYVFKIDNTAKKSDDKEPSNTAGTPIYNIIEKKELNNVLIVVVRYFGGTKLGAGPLTRAYGKSASSLLTK